MANKKTKTTKSLREMEDDFAVIPTPKYDELQENYESHTYDSMFAMVPKTVEDISILHLTSRNKKSNG